MADGLTLRAQDKRGALATSPTIVILIGKHGVFHKPCVDPPHYRPTNGNILALGLCVCGKSPSFNKNLGFRSWVILPLVSLTRGRMFLSQIFLDHTFWGTPHVIARTNTFSIETPVLFPPSLVCVFITTVPSTKLFAWGEGDSKGHVLRETTSRGVSL